MSSIQLHLRDVLSFRNAIKALVEFLPSANLLFTKNEFVISGMDPSRVSLVSYTLSKNDCTSYKCDVGRVIGMNLSLLDRILRTTSSGEECIMTVLEDTIKLELNVKTVKRTFDLPTLDLEIDSVDIPEMDLAADITMSTSDFVGCIKHFHKLNSENVILEAKEDGFRIEVNGDMKGNCLFEPTEDREIAMSGDLVRQDYSLKLVHATVSAAADLSPTIYISFEKDKPIRFKFQISEHSSYLSYIAPKVTDA